MTMTSDEMVRGGRSAGMLISIATAALLGAGCGAAGPDDSFEESVTAAYDEPIGEVEALALEGEGEGEDESSCLRDVTSYGERGPFRYTSRRVGSINMLIPNVPEGCKVPVAHLANGTGARCSIYQSILNALASHGFLTTCYETTNTGSGVEGLQALERAVESYPNLAARKFASLGHSQGGQAAFVVQALAEEKFGADARYAGLAMQPASGFGDQPRGARWQDVYARIKSPMFMFNGTADILVSASWVRRGFAALNDDVEAYNWSARGSTHIPTPNRETIEVAIPWFRWKLLDDNRACQAFKALKSGRTWSQTQVQNEVACD